MTVIQSRFLAKLNSRCTMWWLGINRQSVRRQSSQNTRVRSAHGRLRRHQYAWVKTKFKFINVRRLPQWALASEKSVVFNEHASFYFQWPWYSRCGVCVIRAMCIYSSSPLASFAAGLRVPGSKNAYSRCVRAAREKKSNVQRSTTNIPRTAITNISNNVDWILCQMTWWFLYSAAQLGTVMTITICWCNAADPLERSK